ncbi:hypothetical protein GCK72_020397 [Caenorhabditis remanei]|uniref:Uncharacterized protein n=1 Tax=Caenorhabditis remanei TaxID=31234 RepID=A0A2P4VIM6_CAERE|nr:hypothetical protein GCK72_020397 [Caenorhabditis remanei]KAF1753840.1 hypothetical protein GCK72_020397 [Caenorhabditis remanei]
MSVIVDWIEDCLETYFDVYVDNQYMLLGVAFALFYIYQVLIIVVDAAFAMYNWRNLRNFGDFTFFLALIILSIVYGLTFLLIQPEERRCFGVCSIFATVQLILSVFYYFYMFPSMDNEQLLYFTTIFAPISIFYMTIIVSISVVVSCRMSFFRPHQRVISDLYAVEERNGKKSV